MPPTSPTSGIVEGPDAQREQSQETWMERRDRLSVLESIWREPDLPARRGRNIQSVEAGSENSSRIEPADIMLSSARTIVNDARREISFGRSVSHFIQRSQLDTLSSNFCQSAESGGWLIGLFQRLPEVGAAAEDQHVADLGTNPVVPGLQVMRCRCSSGDWSARPGSWSGWRTGATCRVAPSGRWRVISVWNSRVIESPQ